MALNPPSGIVKWFNTPLGERGWNSFRAQLTGKDYPGASRKTSYVKLSDKEADEVISNIKKDPEGIPIFDEANAPDKAEEYQRWLVARYLTKPREEGFEGRKKEGTKQLEEELGPEGLDELLNLIREESKVEVGVGVGGGGGSSSGTPPPPQPPSSSALAVVPKKEDDLVEENIDPQILSILGLEDVFDLTYEEYASLLKEASVKARMPGSQMSTESTELITDEFKRVKGKTGRFKVKPKKVDINKVLDRKQPTPPGAIVKAQKLIPTAPEVEPEQPEKKTVVTPENLQDDLLNGIGNILESLITIRTTLQSQSKTEQQAEEEDRKETEKKKKKEREAALEKKKPKSPILKALTKPVEDFFEAIKRFFMNVVLGSGVLGFFKWLKDPKNKKAIDDFTNFLENNAGLILGGLLAIATLPIVPTLLSLTGAITGIAIPALKAAFAFLSTPAGLAALLFTAPKLAEKVDPKSFDVITREVISKATKEKLSKQQLITRIKDERSKIGPMDTFMGKGVFYDNLLKRLESGELDSLILETQKEYEEKGEISPSLLEKFTRGTGGLLSDIFSGAGKDIGNLVTKGKVQDTPERQRIRSRLNKIDFLNIFPDDEKTKQSTVQPQTPAVSGSTFINPTPKTNLKTQKGGYAADTGLDIHGKIGDPIVSPVSGTLEYAEQGHTAQANQDSDPNTPGFQPQHSFRIKLDKPFTFKGKTVNFVYGTHLSSLDPSVANKSGIKISQGQLLGKMGQANGVPHLHLGLVGDRNQTEFLNFKEVDEVLGGRFGNGTSPAATPTSPAQIARTTVPTP